MTASQLGFEAGCKTTAMGIMPHADVEKALELALSLDIPFWPQLPNVSFYEDMYAQTSENFPGIAIDLEARSVTFDTARFEADLAGYSERMTDPRAFSLGTRYSAVYHRFLERHLGRYAAIRGQLTGPVSFGFKIVDQAERPIIYNDGVRDLLFDFVQRRANAQYQELRRKNPNAFVWIDEPGLGWVFSGLSGYGDIQARHDYKGFFAGLEGPRGLHLCANVNLPYLLGLGPDILSFDAYQIGVMPKAYSAAIADFLGAGGVISWGIVPTDSTNLGRETHDSLARLLQGYWTIVSQNSGIAVEHIARQALIAPARCCLKNIGQVGGVDDQVCLPSPNGTSIEEQLVERAFQWIGGVSGVLKQHYLPASYG